MYHKQRSYDIRFLKAKVRQTSFCDFGSLLSFLPSDNLKSQKPIFEKLKKTPEDIILHMCTINDNHMIYGSWDMECDGQNLLSFWIIFGSFTP